MRHVRLLEAAHFSDIVISLKSSTVSTTVEAYRQMAKLVEYPLHIGITETGTPARGLIKSAAGLGALLLDGIGDTLRISLTDAPVEECALGVELLRALRLRRDDIEIISCPTCGRTRVDLMQPSSAWTRRCRTGRATCAWPSWAAPSTVPARRRMRISASPLAAAAACCSGAGSALRTALRRI